MVWFIIWFYFGRIGQGYFQETGESTYVVESRTKYVEEVQQYLQSASIFLYNENPFLFCSGFQRE